MVKLNNDPKQVQEWYDKVALEYAQKNSEELKHKPFDREILRRFGEMVKGQGTVCDMGCGPGEVTGFLHQCGCQTIGIDFSPEMIKEARRLNPGLTFEKGDMFALEVEGNSWAGIAAFYTFIHNSPEQLDDLLKEWYRVVKPGGLLLMAFHIGEEVIHVKEFMGQNLPIDFIFFNADDVVRRTKNAGWQIEEISIRYPYPEEVEHQSKRAYVIARK